MFRCPAWGGAGTPAAIVSWRGLRGREPRVERKEAFVWTKRLFVFVVFGDTSQTNFGIEIGRLTINGNVEEEAKTKLKV